MMERGTGMKAKKLDGRSIARLMQKEIAEQVKSLVQVTGQSPSLAIVQVGSDPAADSYIRAIERTFGRVGMRSRIVGLPNDIPGLKFAESLAELNADPTTHGVILQQPIPDQISPQDIATLAPQKDVDGIHPVNAGLLLQGHPGAFVPATPLGGIELLLRNEIPIEGRHAVVVGRSQIVGRPMALLLLHRHATVTLCHSRTREIQEITRQADILAVAVGRPEMITGDMVKPGATVIDFGINYADGQLVGDIEADSVGDVAGYLTPVPGGTGPMTNIMLLTNTLRAAKSQLLAGENR